MTNATFSLQTENYDWGFHGTLTNDGHSHADTDALYVAMGRQLRIIIGPITEKDAQTVLDGRVGRHLANALGGYSDIRDDDDTLVKAADSSGLCTAIMAGDFDRLLKSWQRTFRKCIAEAK